MDEIIKKIVTGKNPDAKNYNIRVKKRDDLYAHAYGDINLLMRLLEVNFPSEPGDILQYRKSVMFPITKTYFSKILRSLSIVRNSSSFSIEYFDENIEEKNDNLFPEGIVQWFFEEIFKMALVDANAYIVVLQGKVLLYESKDILYIDKQSIIVQTSENEYVHYGGLNIIDYYYNEDTKEITAIERYPYDPESENQFTLLDINYFFPVGGNIFKKTKEGYNIYDSLVESIVPFWNDAIIEYSDKKAGIKQHLFPLFWTMSSDECSSCKGSGTVEINDYNYNPVSMECSTCKGTGTMPKGMFSQITVKKDPMGGDVKLPPAGYIQKDFTSIDFLDKDITQNINNGFSAVNMEHLQEVLLNQSGAAKEVDRKEFYAFVNEIGYFCSNILNKVLWANSQWYYKSLGIEETQLSILVEDSTPQIKWVNDVNFSSEVETVNKITNRMAIRRKLESEIPDAEDLKIAQLVLDMDPLPDLTTEEKIALVKNDLTDALTAYISINLERIIKLNIDKLNLQDSFQVNFNKILTYGKEIKGAPSL